MLWFSVWITSVLVFAKFQNSYLVILHQCCRIKILTPPPIPPKKLFRIWKKKSKDTINEGSQISHMAWHTRIRIKKRSTSITKTKLKYFFQFSIFLVLILVIQLNWFWWNEFFNGFYWFSVRLTALLKLC